MNFFKITITVIAVLVSIVNQVHANEPAKKSESTQICINENPDLPLNQISCIYLTEKDVTETDSSEGIKIKYSLLAFNRVGWLLEQMRMSIIIQDGRELLKFEVIPHEKGEDITQWKTIDPKTREVVANKLYDFKNGEKYISLFIKEANVDMYKGTLSPCGEAALFCTLGGAISVTIIAAPIAIIGCTDLVLKCKNSPY